MNPIYKCFCWFVFVWGFFFFALQLKGTWRSYEPSSRNRQEDLQDGKFKTPTLPVSGSPAAGCHVPEHGCQHPPKGISEGDPTQVTALARGPGGEAEGAPGETWWPPHGPLWEGAAWPPNPCAVVPPPQSGTFPVSPRSRGLSPASQNPGRHHPARRGMEGRVLCAPLGPSGRPRVLRGLCEGPQAAEAAAGRGSAPGRRGSLAGPARPQARPLPPASPWAAAGRERGVPSAGNRGGREMAAPEVAALPRDAGLGSSCVCGTGRVRACAKGESCGDGRAVG